MFYCGVEMIIPAVCMSNETLAPVVSADTHPVACSQVEGQLQSNRSASMSEEDENLAILRQ